MANQRYVATAIDKSPEGRYDYIVVTSCPPIHQKDWEAGDTRWSDRDDAGEDHMEVEGGLFQAARSPETATHV